MAAMSQSDRLFLEELCPTLQQRLLEEPPRLVQRLIEDPSARIQDQDFQDFEVGYSLSSEGKELRLKVMYPFLHEVLDRGSQVLLDRVLGGLPLCSLEVFRDHGELVVGVDAEVLLEDEAIRQQCARVLAGTRIYLLVGPLVERLLWLQGAVAAGDEAAARAAPGKAAAAANAAAGPPPPLLQLQVRQLETCWIVAKPDRILVIVSVHVQDEVDVALGRAFCQEFAETNRKATDFSLPCSFSEPKDLPSDLRGLPAPAAPNVGFLTLTLSEQSVRGASEERLLALARPVMTWRNFFHFHLKHAKSYLHSRLRRRLDGWQQQLSRARRPAKRGQATRRLASGKEFTPPPRDRPSTG